MKKFLAILVAVTALSCFASEAQAGLNLSINLSSPYRSYRSCDYGYTQSYYRPVVYYRETPRYYAPRRRVVTYYTEPVYYSERRHSRRHHGYR